MAEQESSIGVAISGGGHRASLFGLGALLYLIDAGKGPQLGSVASVSGGSITNAYVGGVADLSTVDPAEMWAHARTLGAQIVRRGTLWAAPLTYVYLLSVALLVIAAIAITVVIACYCGPWWVIVAAWLVAVGLVGWLSQLRSAVVAKAFDATVFHGAKLADMHGAVSHVLCATDLQMGQDVFFSDSFVYSWRTGWGRPGDLRAAQAAQASAALPGAFNVVSMPLSRFGLPEPGMVEDRNPPQRFKLLDGGVYDNMASEWFLGAADGTPPAPVRSVTEAIVVNASASDDVIDRPWVKVPFVGEVSSLLAVKDVMYRQTTAVRRRLLNVRYQIAQDRANIQTPARLLNQALAGTTIQIDRSPFQIPDAFLQGSPDDFTSRAVAAITCLGEENRTSWAAEADANRRVKTTLSRIDAARAQSLIRHAYALTMINSHVLLGYPLLAIPEVERFATLVAD
jgi:hypothetical protein